MIRIEQHTLGAASIKICKGNYELSIHIDDSCAEVMPTCMFRASLQVYCTTREENGKITYGVKDNVTKQFIPDYDGSAIIPAHFDIIRKILNLMEKKSNEK